MLSGVQRVWGNEPSHSQVNSHCENWSPKWTFKSLKCNCRDQNPSVWRVFYIIKKLLKLKCLKWAHITHLNIWDTSYAQNKGRKSNWHFDSHPLKVRNQPDFLMCKQRATYRWRAFKEGYNYALDLIVIGGLHAKLWAPKVAKVPIVGIPRESQDKMPFGCGLRGESQRIL
jgi:hypothetical protein